MMGLTELILETAAERGDASVVVILDQNLEYDEGKAKGTQIIRELRQAGFSGVALIRSANDDAASGHVYREAGATGCLSKKSNVKELALDVARHCRRVWGNLNECHA